MEKTKSCKRKMRIAIGILLLEFAYMLFMGIGGVHATDETLPTVDGKLIETETMSTYDNEDSCEKIDYFRHIRNAVAHSKCNYFSDRGKNFVIFSV